MNVSDYIILAVLAIGIFFALRASFGKRKKGCSGGCAGCSGCSGQSMKNDDIV